MKKEFSIDIVPEIQRLIGMTGKTEAAHVISDALSVYRLLAERVDLGYRIYVGPDRESARELSITTLEHIRNTNDARKSS